MGKKNVNGLTRRDFLRSSGAVGAGADCPQ